MLVGQRVRGVRVDLQRDVGPSLAHGLHRLEVPPRLDLQLDALVALVEVPVDLDEQLLDRREDADRHAAVDGVADRAEPVGERPALRAELGVEHRHLERRLGHRVALHSGEERLHGVGVEILRGEQPRDEMCAHHVLRAVRVLGGVERLGHRDALAPSVADVGDDPYEERVTFELQTERGAERGHERQRDAP